MGSFYWRVLLLCLPWVTDICTIGRSRYTIDLSVHDNVTVFRTDIAIETDARLSRINGTNGVFVGSRINQGGCHITGTRGFFFFVYPGSQTFVLTGDLGKLGDVFHQDRIINKSIVQFRIIKFAYFHT